MEKTLLPIAGQNGSGQVALTLHKGIGFLPMKESRCDQVVEFFGEAAALLEGREINEMWAAVFAFALAEIQEKHREDAPGACSQLASTFFVWLGNNSSDPKDWYDIPKSIDKMLLD